MMGGALVCVLLLTLGMQAPGPQVVGVVRDARTGEPLPGAEVVFRDLDRAVVSDDAGRYAIAGVPPGPQHIAVAAPGYERRALHALVPAAGVLRLDFALRVQPIELDPLTVRAHHAAAADAGGGPSAVRTLGTTALHYHPLLSEPDPLHALAGADVVVAPEAPSGVHIRGGASDQTAFLLDDVPVLSPYHAAGVFSAWNPDALARIEPVVDAPAPALPDALSGVIAAYTRAPGPRLGAVGALTTTQLRIAIDGPVGPAGGGFLLSARTGFPGLLLPGEEPSYIRGGTDDLLATVRSPLLGGAARLLVYDAHNALRVAARADAGEDTERHRFEWRSTSLGAGWSGNVAGRPLQVQLWHARGSAASQWLGTARTYLDATRRDAGALATLTWNGSSRTTVTGVRLLHSATWYAAGPDTLGMLHHASREGTAVAALFVQHTRELRSTVRVDASTSALLAVGRLHVAPRLRVDWEAAPRLQLGASYARTYQFAQSLRNTESIVGQVFPAELYVGADPPAVPVARADQIAISAQIRPLDGVVVRAHGYARRLRGLALVAPVEAGPFATGEFVTGSADVQGFALETAANGARHAALLRYGWQAVALAAASSEYTPAHGPAHLLDAGLTLFPGPTWSIRAAAHAVLGRRVTALDGVLEWEACNLLDHGCEFGGAPELAPELGATRLPAYVRLDIGGRKHWHLDVRGRDVLVGLSGTLTNLLSRANVLTETVDRSTGRRAAVEMLPLAPLVIGVDWRF